MLTNYMNCSEDLNCSISSQRNYDYRTMTQIGNLVINIIGFINNAIWYDFI